MTGTSLSTRAFSHRSPFACVATAAAVLGAALLGSVSTAAAQKITVWSGYPEMAPFYAHVAAGLKAKNPKLEVSVEAIPLREHEKRVALGITSGGSGTLIIELPSSTANRYLSNDLLPKAPANVAAFVNDPKNFDSFFRDNASFNGAVVAVPLFRGQGALFYNTDMFKAAGLTKPPTTMEEYDSYAAKLTQRDASGKATVSGWSLRLSGGGQGIAEKFWINMFQYGGNLLTPQSGGKWKVTLANDAGFKALKQYLVNVHKAKTVTPEMPADADAFERGQTAMFIRESWVIADIAKKAPNLNYATAPLPTGSIGLPANLYVSAKSSADAEAAWAFALAANEPDNLVWLLKNVGWLPNRSGVDYSSVTSTTPAFAAFVDYPKGYKFFTLPAIDPIEEILTRVAARLSAAFADAKLVDDDAAIKKVLAETEAQANAILEREGLLAK